jgi:hypothetical protein
MLIKAQEKDKQNKIIIIIIILKLHCSVDIGTTLPEEQPRKRV